MKLGDILKSKDSKIKDQIQQLKNELKQIGQKEHHSIDDIVQYFTTQLALDDVKNKPEPFNRFNMFSGDYLPLATASIFNAPISDIKKAYNTIIEKYPELYVKGIETADHEEKRSPITKHPFEFDKKQLRLYRKKQYGTQAKN